MTGGGGENGVPLESKSPAMEWGREGEMARARS